MMAEKKWICLSEKSFVNFINDKSVFMYNAEIYSILYTENPDFLTLLHELQNPANLGSIEFCDENMNNVVLEAINKGLLYIENNSNKPLILLPILNLQRDLERGDCIEHQISIMGNKARFVTGINICINIPFPKVNNKVDAARMETFSQLFVRTSNIENAKSLSYENLKQILNSLFITSIKNIDLIINLSSMENGEIERLSSLLEKYPYNYRIHSYIDGMTYQTIKKISLVHKNISLILYFDRYTVGKSQPYLESVFVSNMKNVSFCKVVYGKDDIIFDSHVDLKPIWTKDNIDFLKEFVYLSWHDIISTRPTIREIMRNTKLNYNFFGILDILPNGNILPHGSNICIGKITDKNFIVNSVINEFKNNRSWRLTRNLVDCKNCKFRYMCPPISAIELASNEFKICNS